MKWLKHLVCSLCYLSTWCVFCFVSTIQASVRRRLRRARAIARYKWWLYRTGGIDQNLHVSVLSWILRTLSGHHSKDIKHIAAVRRQLKAAMAYTESQPWRCVPCRRLVKAKQQFCPNCGSWWEDVFDKDYQPSTQRQVKDQSWTWNSWQENPQRRPRTPARKQSRSTSANRKGKGGEKGKDKGKEKGKEKGKDKSQEQVSPFVNAALMVPLAPTPFPTMQSSATSTMHMADAAPGGSTSQPGAELIAAIKKAFPDASSLPVEIREALDKTEVAVTKDLHRATSALGRAQKSLRELEEAKEKHRNQWLSHLKDALQSWHQQMQSYEDQQEAFNTAIIKAKTDLNQSHRSIQVLNAKAAGKTPPEAAPVESDGLGPPQGEEDSEEKALRKQVHQALAQCALKVSEKLSIKEFPELVEVPSGDEEEKRRLDAKRLRSTSPARDGQSHMDTTAAAKANANKP